MTDLYDTTTYAQLAYTKELVDALERRSSAVRKRIAAANESKHTAMREVEQSFEGGLKAARERHAKLRKATEDAEQAILDLEERVWHESESVGKEYMEKILSMESELARLSTERDKLRSSVAPIKRLPAELLREIFFSHIELGHTPLSLSRVCHVWREITLACPDLWSRLSIHVGDGNSSNSTIPANYIRCVTPKMAGCFLARSKGHPLSIWIHVYKPNTTLFSRILQVLVEDGIWCRWRSLVLGTFNLGNRDVPPLAFKHTGPIQLQQLFIKPLMVSEYSFFLPLFDAIRTNPTPHLRSIDMKGLTDFNWRHDTPVDETIASLVAPSSSFWSQLRSFIGLSRQSSFQHIHEWGTMLQHLAIEDIAITSSHKFSFITLRSLRLSDTKVAKLAYLDAPRLQSLVVRQYGGADHSSRPPAPHSIVFPELLHLEIAPPPDDKHVIGLAAPKLRHLKLQGPPIGNKQLVQWFHGSPEMLHPTSFTLYDPLASDQGVLAALRHLTRLEEFRVCTKVVLGKKFWEGLLVKTGRNAKPALCPRLRILKVQTWRMIGRKSHVDLSEAMINMVSSREAAGFALSNAIACGEDGDDEVIELRGTVGELPPDPRFVYSCATPPQLTTLPVSLLQTYGMTLIGPPCIIDTVISARMVPSIYSNVVATPEQKIPLKYGSRAELDSVIKHVNITLSLRRRVGDGVFAPH